MNLLRVLAAVSGITLLSRITGLAREMVVAALFGVSSQTDAFRVAFLIPNLLRRLFAEGAFSQAFVPILGEFKVRRGEIETKALVDHVAMVLTVVLLGITILGIAGAPLLVFVLASGLQHAHGTFDLAVLMTRLMFPYILLVSLVAAASGVLNTWRQFTVPAFTPVLLNLCWIYSALVFSRYVDPPILALTIGVMLGGVTQLAIQVPALRRVGMLPRFDWDLRGAFADEGVRRVMRKMLPAIFAVSVAQLSLIINVNIATRIGPGSVSWINYADRLMEFPTALLGAGLGTILTPSLSAARARGDNSEYGALIDWGMRLSVLLALPCALALWMISVPLTATLFQRGAFTPDDVVKTAQAVAAYGVGLVGLILVKILAPGFYASQDIRTPVKIGILVLIATQLFNLVTVPLFAHAGLAFSTSLGALLNALLLYLGLRRAKTVVAVPGWFLFLLKISSALLVLGLVLWWGNREIDWIAVKSGAVHRVLLLGSVIVAGAAAYLGTLFATGCGWRISNAAYNSMTPLDYFSTLVKLQDDNDSIPLTEAALSIAQDVYPQLDMGAVQSELDRLAAVLRSRLASDTPAVQRLRALNRYFFRELGFSGNRNDYYDPDNSYLNRVLERRRGIPISLAVLYMELGQQIGLPLRGISFPGHFLVKLKVRNGDIFLDPYSGQSLTKEQLEERLAQFFDARGLDVPTDLALIPSIQEASARDILMRMLRNLKSVYHDRKEFERLLHIQNRLVVLLPDMPSERRDRGLIYAQLECPRAALEDLDFYLQQEPEAVEASEIRHTISMLREALNRLN